MPMIIRFTPAEQRALLVATVDILAADPFIQNMKAPGIDTDWRGYPEIQGTVTFAECAERIKDSIRSLPDKFIAEAFHFFIRTNSFLHMTALQAQNADEYASFIEKAQNLHQNDYKAFSEQFPGWNMHSVTNAVYSFLGWTQSLHPDMTGFDSTDIAVKTLMALAHPGEPHRSAHQLTGILADLRSITNSAQYKELEDAVVSAFEILFVSGFYDLARSAFDRNCRAVDIDDFSSLARRISEGGIEAAIGSAPTTPPARQPL